MSSPPPTSTEPCHRELLAPKEKWLNPEASCGQVLYSYSGVHFWEPRRRAAQTWSHLGPRILEIIEGLQINDEVVSMHIAMVGMSEKASSPRILLCSKSPDLLQRLYIAIDSAGVMNKYPSVGIDACSNPPVPLTGNGRLARRDGVWATRVGLRFGRQIYMYESDADAPRVATAGWILPFAGRFYQVTAVHIYNNAEGHQELSLESDPNQGDSDGESMDGEVENQNAPEPERPDWTPPADASFIGKIVHSRSNLDYALIELSEVPQEDLNVVAYGEYGAMKVVVGNIGRIEIRPPDTPVVVVTSSGSLNGRLSVIPCFIKPVGQTKFQTVYPVRMDGNNVLRPGDSGSGVVDIRTAEILGHIVSAHRGTHLAYIAPMHEIMEDIRKQPTEARSGKPEKPSKLQAAIHEFRSWPWLPTPPWTDPHYLTEFSSQQFFRLEVGHEKPKRLRAKGSYVAVRERLSRLRLPDINKLKRLQTTNTSFEAHFFSLPGEIRDMIIKQLPPRSAWSLRQVSRAWRAEVSINAQAISHLFTHRHPLPPLAREIFKVSSPDEKADNENKRPPPDLLVIEEVRRRHEVISRLAFRMSRWLGREIFQCKSAHQWREFKAQKRQMIQRRLIPPLFAIFHFLDRYSASILEHCSSKNINSFQYPAEADAVALLPASSRTPTHDKNETVLRLAFKQVVNDRKYSRKNTSTQVKDAQPCYEFEASIMKLFPDDILTQSHMAFCILMQYLQYLLRAPSYQSSLELVVRGHLRPKHHQHLDDRAHATILCVGGLNAITQFADVTSLDRRRVEVDKFLEEALANPIVYKLPEFNNIWRPTAETVLVERGIFKGRRDITNYSESLTRLVRSRNEMADELYQDHALWHSLCDRYFGNQEDEDNI